jgi:hypothetical protein
MTVLVHRLSVLISSGGYLSSSASFNGQVPQVLHMPAAWDAAVISFATSPDGTNFYFLYDSAGLIISLPADANRRILLPTTHIAYTNGLKIASGVPGATVNQTADRTLYLEFWS